MSTQSGLKHAATEPSRLDKRERRRVGGGTPSRAAVLRRAPSDSDCSAETASLSADSADRVRPAPPPTRQQKARRTFSSRRRGSEWEVLEGLKDGQRFDRRPEVFNGYLHKKRKWPLKGWHKRFFVVDGGILVYARSPTDVARGRLHGSVDVGLSVISAKARRRRIDIDADEFIYHLRAKTPDVFRTWLNVLKAHRLYRQHLLTFGARESAPKIHPPVEDLPTNDSSSRSSTFTMYTSSTSTVSREDSDSTTTILSEINFKGSSSNSKKNLLWISQNQYPIKVYLMKNTSKNAVWALKKEMYHSVCSLNCTARIFSKESMLQNASIPLTDLENQITSTELDDNSLRPDPCIDSSFVCAYTFNGSRDSSFNVKPNQKVCIIKESKKKKYKEKTQQSNTILFFTRKKRDVDEQSPMKRSRKCTNLFKYKMAPEPRLSKPLSRSMLLSGKHKVKDHKETSCVLFETCTETQDGLEKQTKSVQNVMTKSLYDGITEKIVTCLFKRNAKDTKKDEYDINNYVGMMVKELYEVKFSKVNIHPIKVLFRYLLEYWLKNNAADNIRDAFTNVKCIDRQSNNYFTKDAYVSSVAISSQSKETQFLNDDVDDSKPEKPLDEKPHDNSEPEKPQKTGNNNNKDIKHFKTESYEKERQIQELEKLLKNTVYICETVRSNKSRDKDIQMTRRLMENLGKYSYQSRSNSSDPSNDDSKENSHSSAEYPKIQKTFDRLISETSIPPNVAKELLGVYLDVLIQENTSNNKGTSSSSAQNSKDSQQDVVQSQCDVQTESVQKKVSKCISTINDDEKSDKKFKVSNADTGQMYLKDILDKITSIFKFKKFSDAKHNKDNDVQPDDTKVEGSFRNEIRLPVAEFPGKKILSENINNNSVVIDLSKYDLEHISMYSDPNVNGVMSITIKLREKPPNCGESGNPNLNIRFSKENQKSAAIASDSDSYPTKKVFHSQINQNLSFKNPYIDYDLNANLTKNRIELKPYLSSSDATSKAFCRIMRESEHSIDFAFKNSNFTGRSETNSRTDSKKSFVAKEAQSCYMMANFRKLSAFHSKRKNRVQNCRPTEFDVFEKSYPRIIDEKFILLLLENLTLLSQNLPTLHKDIYMLYVKLKRRHEKDLKNSSMSQGLGLLGKIYNDNENCRLFNETGTQFEPECAPKKEAPIIKDVSTVTSKTGSTNEQSTNKVHKALSVINNKRVLLHKETLTEKHMKCGMAPKIRKVVLNATTSTYPDCKSVPDEADDTKMPNQTKDYIRNQDINLQTVKECYPNSQFITKYNNKIEKLKKEIISLSRNFKVSRLTQTYLPVPMKFRDDFIMYQLFMCEKGKKSSSESNVTAEDRERDGDMKTIYRATSDPFISCSGLVSPTSPPLRGPQAGFVSGTPGGRLAGWIIEAGGPLENVSRELGQAQLSVQQLQRLLNALELQHQAHHDTDVSLEGASPSVKKDRRKFGLRKKKSSTKCASVELAPPHMDPSNSHMALSALTAPPSPGGGACSIPNSAASLPIACVAARPQSLPGAEALGPAAGPASLTSLTPDQQIREDFTVLAKDLLATLKGVVSTLVCERGRLRAAMEAAESTASPGGAVMAALRTNLNSALQQNSELRSRLSRIHDASDLNDVSLVNNAEPVNRLIQQSLSYSSSCVSASEFFDAEEHDDDLKPAEILGADEAGVIELDGDSSSEAGSLSSEDGSGSSDNSDGALLSAEPVTLTMNQNGERPSSCWTRRTALPAPRPTPGGPSLWNLLYKNIGKDLSQISMPVTINEPLNMLQRLCEELEYSELLDSASECRNPVERMALVAAFAVSAYAASAHRAASKPFNPLLAETYECIRDDRGFRFLAEQVSHHPPISACHAESPRWCFWQEARIKTKFWGKSMEFQPTGRVHVRLLTTGDHYSWNKVTTCVHNLFGGQRWVDQYGDMSITCHGTEIVCKLNFIKASSWSSSRHEVRGAVTDGASGARLRLQGRWSEALYAGDPPAARCLWRPGAMPPEHELYYGFTRFAMELNELEPGMRDLLPYTDTRLRPDQRALEEGNVEAAEQHKHALEQAQRERRRDYPHHMAAWFRKVNSEGEETWVFTGEYWKAREAGFPTLNAPRIW